MAYEQRDGSGSLFPNDKREKDTQPNLRGSITINGVAYWLDAWTKLKADGTKWLSLSAKPKEASAPVERTGSAPPKPAAQVRDFDDDSSIPF